MFVFRYLFTALITLPKNIIKAFSYTYYRGYLETFGKRNAIDT